MKNGERVLIEGNTLSYSWGGFSQVGYCVVFTSRGTWAAVQDITFRYNMCSHTGSGLSVVATQTGTLVDSLAEQRLSFHDDIFQDISAAKYDGSGISIEFASGYTKNVPLNNVLISNLTMDTDPSHTLMVVGMDPTNPLRPFNITIINNVFRAGRYPVWSIGGPIGKCATADQPNTVFTNCWTNWSFTDNTVYGSSTQYLWPPGNTVPTGASYTKILASH
jgi:hypothetical protein